jgi:hypothetical protein
MKLKYWNFFEMLIVTINLKCSILLSLICKEISYENSNQCNMQDVWSNLDTSN